MLVVLVARAPWSFRVLLPSCWSKHEAIKELAYSHSCFHQKEKIIPSLTSPRPSLRVQLPFLTELWKKLYAVRTLVLLLTVGKEGKRKAIFRFCFLFLNHRLLARWNKIPSTVLPLVSHVIRFVAFDPHIFSPFPGAYRIIVHCVCFAPTSASASRGITAVRANERTSRSTILYCKLQKKREPTGYKTWEAAFVHRRGEREKRR